MATKVRKSRPKKSLRSLNVVMDLSHQNRDPDLATAKHDGGILGVIHKATQGVTYIDPTYVDHRHSAVEADLLWGAYHFGTGSDGILQAEHFLEIVEPSPDTLLVLDFEANA
jgi:lysozyme